MKIKFLLHGLHPASPQYPAHLTPYVLYEENVSENQRAHYKEDIDKNVNLIAFAQGDIEEKMWIRYRLKRI